MGIHKKIGIVENELNVPLLRERYAKFFKLLDSYFAPPAIEDIERALSIVDEKMEGMLRYDGTPLIWHPINTAMIVISEIGLGRNSTISTLLHDVVRVGEMSAVEVGNLFGDSCVTILNGMNLISDVETKESKEQAANFRDLIVSYSTDPRVILIKLADRLEVMRTLEMFPEQKRHKKSWESLNLYAQIAHRLGLYPIKSELEDVSLSFLEPEAYADIVKKLADSATEREEFIAKFLKPIKDKLNQQGEIKYTIKSRTKSVYSIWSKMRRMRIPFEEIYDIFALRIIVDCEQAEEKQLCWSVYSIVTDFYTPNTDRMRDWISIPKSNGYESLHTTVVDKEGNWVEIQIRSERMDEVAERGIAAHWRYKGVKQGGMSSEQWLAKVREIIEEEPQDIAHQFDEGGTMNEVFVFTPKGDLRKMKEGATLLDFAFEIHTNLGETCIGGRVNQRNVQLREVLKNGDIVEIYTSKNQTPKPDWLSFTTTNRARNKIRAYLREQEAREANLGREELERKLKNWKLDLTIDDCVNVLSKHYKTRSGTKLYGKIADGKININEVKEVLTRHLSGTINAEAPRIRSFEPQAPMAYSDDILVIDDDIRSIEYRFGKCCNPIFGDNVFGFVTINTGITIHRKNCPNAARLKTEYPYRVLPVQWRSNKGDTGAFQASIRVVADNVTGVVNRITELISSDLKINIRSMSLSPNNKGELSGLINIEVTGTQVIDMVINNISKIKGVQRAYRAK